MNANNKKPDSATNVVLISTDADFRQMVVDTFATHPQIALDQFDTGISGAPDAALNAAAVVVVDLDASKDDQIAELAQLTTRPGIAPMVVVTEFFDENVARRLLQIRVADFLVKPVAPIELVRACARAAKAPPPGEPVAEAEIFTFLPAAGGVGVTSIAIQSALLLQGTSKRGSSTCLVDLDFQHGAVADYLDLEPRLDLSEIEPRPERLDRHLLEVMLTRHSSGLSVIAAPHRPAEMRSFDPVMVTRLLDLVSANFRYVVIDMPRTWFSWTDSVLLGSNKLFIVSEMTIPGLRHAKKLVSAISERHGENCNPQVIVNRFEQRMFVPGLKHGDIESALGKSFAGTLPNNFRIVREAIDRGVPLEEVKPGNNVTMALRKLIMPHAAAKSETGGLKRLFARAG
ncbi:MAG: response regulator receiver protein [Xanthobacteraceae bacterium]|nr:response regulator receiver protein [Xanthobacteraceae bacterium]QYK45214.1 MAG: response regulator receiver protein [Xanthobacteraceae bacterium]HMN50571.1 response regulator receiver protein [Xanthobacteraceae bacterium]